MSNTLDFQQLREPFEALDIEWRIQQSGVKNGKPWAMALAYITNRAIQQRLDDVCKPENWRNEYASAPDGGVMCGISIKVDGEWITKWDGAENTDVEAVKGGLSNSMKRAAVQWGIGRYLYKLDTTFVEIRDKGQHYIAIKEDKKDPKSKTHYGYWDDPQLPGWALPEGTPKADKTPNTSKKVGGNWKPDANQPVSNDQRMMIVNLLRQKGVEGKDDVNQYLWDNYGRPPENEKDAQMVIDDLEIERKEKSSVKD